MSGVSDSVLEVILDVMLKTKDVGLFISVLNVDVVEFVYILYSFILSNDAAFVTFVT